MKRQLTILIEFDTDKQPNWVWDSHRDGKNTMGFYVLAICEGNQIANLPLEEIIHDLLDGKEKF